MNASTAPDAIQAIQDPKIYNYENIASAQPKCSELLKILQRGTWKQYKEFIKNSQDWIKENKIDEQKLTHKMKLLELSTMAQSHEGDNLSYSEISSQIEISNNQVEEFVINVIQSGLVEAKIDQLEQNVNISRATFRTFEESQWTILEDKLSSWHDNLTGILDTITQAKNSLVEDQPTGIDMNHNEGSDASYYED